MKLRCVHDPCQSKHETAYCGNGCAGYSPRAVRVYLAGNMSGCQEDIWRGHRDRLRSLLDAEMNGCAEIEYLDPTEGKIPYPGSVVERDLSLVESSDVVLAYYHFPGIGTAMELAASFYLGGNRKAVVWCNDASLAMSPWLHHFSVGVFLTADGAAKFAAEWIRREILGKKTE